MTVFDTDIFSDFLQSRLSVVAKASAIPREEQAITIVTVEEMFRGRFDTIRKAEAGKVSVPLDEAYARFGLTLEQIRHITILPYTKAADTLCQAWKAAKIRIGSQDLRIAAICFAHNAKLVTRNRRHFNQVPGLNLEVWT